MAETVKRKLINNLATLKQRIDSAPGGFKVSTNNQTEKIAVIGTGVAGLSIAYALAHPMNQNRFQITLFESANRLGGHARTISLTDGVLNNKGNGQSKNKLLAIKKKLPAEIKTPAELAIDTGFIVYNEHNYPELTALFKHLGVATQYAPMTFCYHHAEKKYNFTSDKPFLDWVSFFNLRHHALLLEILRFQRKARKLWQDLPDSINLLDWIDSLKVSNDFKQRYLLPLGSAIWSMPLDKITEYPAKYFAYFFYNHGLFTVNNQPRWRTVVGGSKTYVNKMANAFYQWGVNLRLNYSIKAMVAASKMALQPVAAKYTNDQGWWLKGQDGSAEYFDKVVFACHSDQALAIIKTAGVAHVVLDALAKIPYRASQVFTHRNKQFMPNKKQVYACWNFYQANEKTTLSYWMNKLQNLTAQDDFFVTLNPEQNLSEYDDKTIMHHPQYNHQVMVAQQRIFELQGQDDMYFCGAYLGYGFHEDGIKSAVKLLKYFNSQKPW